MITREEVFAEVKRLLVDHFELDESAVTPDARLYEDLDIDSIDAVDLLVELRNYTGKKLNPTEFKEIRTIDDLVSAVSSILTK